MRFITAVLLLAPGVASAHAILTGSMPALDGTVPAGPTHMVLRFNSRIDPVRSRITYPTAVPAVSAGPAELAADVMLEPGKQVLRWQVLATDGHVTRGELRFTVVPKPGVPKPGVPKPGVP